MSALIARMVSGTTLTFALAFGQSADKALTFDVARIKRASSSMPDGRIVIGMLPRNGGPTTERPGRIHYPVVSLKYLLIDAYDVKDFQIVGPGWLNDEFFDVEATVPPDTTKEQFRIMLQNLLSERFKLAIHRETKERPIYSLVVIKSSPKMKKSAITVSPDARLSDFAPHTQRPQLGEDGFPIRPNIPTGRAGIFRVIGTRGVGMTARQQTMHDLAEALSRDLKRPVLDETSLTAKYDFTLTFLPELMAPRVSDAEPLPDIFSALQSQLGLKLQPKKGPAETIFVDHVEKTPTEN